MDLVTLKCVLATAYSNWKQISLYQAILENVRIKLFNVFINISKFVICYIIFDPGICFLETHNP